MFNEIKNFFGSAPEKPEKTTREVIKKNHQEFLSTIAKDLVIENKEAEDSD